LIMFPYLKLVSSAPTLCRMYSIRYNILSLTDFQHICDFLINNTGSHSITEIYDFLLSPLLLYVHSHSLS
jgi:hypothetical protein